ncbi:MAG: hypothetical protein HWD59_04360 [Coxiellaceae bacterium]|nr:MAG: hypothetical protein HWD59_04360 [Coxiellaceae bacterium]
MPNQDLQRRIIQALAMGHFEKLELINCIALNDENLIRLLKNSPDIKELRLINCDNLGEEAIRYIAEKCKELKELHFQSSKLKKLTGHAPFLKSAPLTFDQLEVLDVSGCGSLTKADLVAPNLKHFRARNCPLKMLRISNTPALPGECRLERLDISGAELKDLTLISQVLETLIMEDCSVLASFKIAGQPTCPSLRFVNITNSPFLLQEFGHKEATKKYPKIRELIVAKESFSVIKENWHGPDEVTFCTQLTKDQGIKVSFDLAFLYGMLPRIRKKDFIVSVMKKGLEYDAKFILDFIFLCVMKVI